MKKYIFGLLSIALIPIISLLIFNFKWKADYKHIGDKQMMTPKFHGYLPPPGTELIFDGKLATRVFQLGKEKKAMETIVVQSKIALRTYIEANGETIRSLSFKGFEIVEPQRNDKQQNQKFSEIYYAEKNGLVERFTENKDANSLQSHLLKSIALALQIDRVNVANDSEWQGLEKGPNGTYKLNYKLDDESGQQVLTKDFLETLGSSAISIANGSKSYLRMSVDSGFLETLYFKLGLISKNQVFDILGEQEIELKLESIYTNLEIFDPLHNQNTELVTSPVTAMPKELKDSKQMRMKRILGQMTEDDMIGNLNAIKEFSDKNISETFNKLEAMLFLYPEFGKDLLDYLEKNRDQKNFDVILSVVMGGLATMSGHQIEAELLDFSQKFADTLDIIQQTAFALAELDNSSFKSIDFLNDLSMSSDQDIKTIGALSLGVAGSSENHSVQVHKILVERLSEANSADKVVYIAALNNSRNQNNFPYIKEFSQSSDDSVAAQAVYGFKFIEGDSSFNELKKILSQETREAVLLEGIKALSGHVKQNGWLVFIQEMLEKTNSVKLQLELVSVLNESSQYDQRIIATLKWVQTETKFPTRVRDLARDVLLTI